MTDLILVLNAGSSSIKFAVFDTDTTELQSLLRGQIEGITTSPHFIARDVQGKTLDDCRWGEGSGLGHSGALAFLLDWISQHTSGRRIAAVGHRVVHGGADHSRPVRLTPDLARELEALVPLAPLHQPHNLAPIRVLFDQAPHLPQVACFDTAFHRDQPAVAQAFALPEEITGRGVLRYGFHGLSYEYIADALQRIDPGAAAGRTIVAHLGNGASMCAMKAGRSVATTMGFTALDGLPMGTRCGALDPGVILFLFDQLGMDARGVEELLYKRSGFLGVSGISSDMRELRASADPRARSAIDLFTYRIGREIGSLAAALGGLDALVFTGGIGENDKALREQVCRDAAWLGLELDEAANSAARPCISAPGSAVAAWVIPTHEELMIARHTRRLTTTG